MHDQMWFILLFGEDTHTHTHASGAPVHNNFILPQWSFIIIQTN